MARINQKAGEVSFGRAIKDFFSGYVDFKGRTTRAGYWWVHLVGIILVIGLYIGFIVKLVQDISSSMISGGGEAAATHYFLSYIWIFIVIALIGLALLLPSIALQVRRYRDAGLRGRGTLVLWVLTYACAYTQIYSQFNTLAALNDLNTNNQLVVHTSGGTFLIFISIILSLFFFITSVLPSDSLTIQNSNPILRFFFRTKRKETTQLDEF